MDGLPPDIPGWIDCAAAWRDRVEWSAADLAALDIQHLPATERNMREWLARQGCAPREITLPTGGRGLVKVEAPNVQLGIDSITLRADIEPGSPITPAPRRPATTREATPAAVRSRR